MARLDSEKVTSFQTTYYILLAAGSTYLWLGARRGTETIEQTLTPVAYNGWLILNIAAPICTLWGRRLVTISARIKPNEPNPALLGAWLQAAGDGGVWGAICIYIGCVINTTWWGQPLYASFFVLMGVPAGFMFTVRSWRRICQINARANRMRR